MARKIILFLLAGILLFAGIIYYKFFSSKTDFSGERKFLYIRSDAATRQAVLDSLSGDSIVTNLHDFDWLAGKMGLWEKIKPGKYRIDKGASVFAVAKKLRSGDQVQVRLVINKLRLPEDMARLVGKNFQADSASVMQFLDKHPEAFHKVIPDTYIFPWTFPLDNIFTKVNDEYDDWWKKKDRSQKAASLGYTPGQIYTIASIVEEESNVTADKPKIASVYFNRLKKNMPLQADPTIRYALKNFNMNRVYYNSLMVQSPYNTYRNAGLPPGPICTPSQATIDAVLDAPVTDYLYFVANPDLMGGSTFTSTYTEHTKVAKEYQDSLSAWLLRKEARQKADSPAKPTRP